MLNSNHGAGRCLCGEEAKFTTLIGRNKAQICSGECPVVEIGRILAAELEKMGPRAIRQWLLADMEGRVYIQHVSGIAISYNPEAKVFEGFVPIVGSGATAIDVMKGMAEDIVSTTAAIDSVLGGVDG